VLDQFPIAIRQVGLAKGRRITFIDHEFGACSGFMRLRHWRASAGPDIFGPGAPKVKATISCFRQISAHAAMQHEK
jgi:hypothetical protein